jgi:hypothetical protein
MRRLLVPVLAAVTLALVPSPARADLTAFIGATTDPGPRFTRGVSVGFSLIIVGFEFEWADAAGDGPTPACAILADDCAPGLTTGMANVLVQTPRAILPFQLYGTVGAGVYRERVQAPLAALERRETHVGTNIGGGVKIELLGPLRLRLDYRVFRLAGNPLRANPQRFYAGVNLAF